MRIENKCTVNSDINLYIFLPNVSQRKEITPLVSLYFYACVCRIFICVKRALNLKAIQSMCGTFHFFPFSSHVTDIIYTSDVLRAILPILCYHLILYRHAAPKRQCNAIVCYNSNCQISSDKKKLV